METAVELAGRVAAWLGEIDGVAAVVLGGSWARDEGRPDSDVDLGIYYHPARPPSIAALRRLAQELDDRRPPDAATELGEWGPWINGGAWLQIGGWRMDWLYRDLERVAAIIAECRAGRIGRHYQPGHPAGFFTHIYMGEMHNCRPLVDPAEAVARLKSLTVPYPPLMKRALIGAYLWQAGFALETCRAAAGRGDTYHVAGSLVQCATGLVQVLFALNERYYSNEKGAVRAIDSFAVRPDGFADTIARLLGQPGRTPKQLRASVEQAQRLVDSVQALCARFPM